MLTGPTRQSAATESATVHDFAPSASRSISASWTLSSTSTREQAEHFWPLAPNAERRMPFAAFSRSAVAVTMVGFLPPISVMHGRE